MSASDDVLREAELLGVVHIEADLGIGYRVTLRGRNDDIGVEITSTRPTLAAALEAVLATARKWGLRR